MSVDIYGYWSFQTIIVALPQLNYSILASHGSRDICHIHCTSPQRRLRLYPTDLQRRATLTLFHWFYCIFDIEPHTLLHHLQHTAATCSPQLRTLISKLCSTKNASFSYGLSKCFPRHPHIWYKICIYLTYLPWLMGWSQLPLVRSRNSGGGGTFSVSALGGRKKMDLAGRGSRSKQMVGCWLIVNGQCGYMVCWCFFWMVLVNHG